MEDVEFTFNPQTFINGVNSLILSLDSFESKSSIIGEKIDNIMMKVGSSISTVAGDIKNNIEKRSKSISGSISNFFTQLPGKFSNVIKNLPVNILNAFKKGSNIVKNFFSNMISGFKKSDESVKNTTKSSDGLLNKLLKIGIVAGLAVGAFQLMQRIFPEIGMAISIISEIFIKNLLNPIRKELWPLLMKILNWVTENRTLFVKMGSILANVFKVALTIVKDFFVILKNSLQDLIDGLKQMFGIASMTIEDTLNLILFKITVVSIFIMSIMEPVINFLVKSFITLVGWVKNFFEGFIIGFGEASPVFDNLMATLNSLLSIYREFAISNDTIAKSFKSLGVIIGAYVKTVLLTAIQTIDTLVSGIALLINNIKKAKAFLGGKDTTSYNEMNKQLVGGLAQRSQERGELFIGSASEVGSSVQGIMNPVPTVNPTNNVNNETNNNVNVTVNVTGNNNDVNEIEQASQAGVVAALRDQQNAAGD